MIVRPVFAHTIQQQTAIIFRQRSRVDLDSHQTWGNPVIDP